MRRIRIAVVAGIAVLAAGAQHAGQVVWAQSQSQWDGVYTSEQAARGEKLYAGKCASCHGQALMGGEQAPPLIGSEFATNWNDLRLGDLFERIRISMPQDNAGSLSRQENADIVAFMLSRGNYPAGEAELPAQASMLNQYKFLAVNPHSR